MPYDVQYEGETKYPNMSEAELKALENWIQSLGTKPRTRRKGTRYPTLTHLTSEERRFIDNLRSKTTRAITVEERAKVAEIAKDQPNIDLEITFDYDSANITARAADTGESRTSAEQSRPQRHGISGRRPYRARGGDAYNQNRSERRAEAVKRFLIEKSPLDTRIWSRSVSARNSSRSRTNRLPTPTGASRS
jgi:outer membrane protein OmpA-like peptidoglycan-associated protein